MTKTFLLLKIASILLILIGLMHSIGHFVEPPINNDTERQLFGLMRDYHFTDSGAMNRTMWHIYLCFSWSFSLFSISTGVMGLFLLRQKIESAVLKKIFWLILVFVNLFVLINLLYAIVIPIVLYSVTWLIFLSAMLLWPKA